MRDRKNFALYENALKSVGIKAVKESTDTFLSAYEIQVLMNLLRILDNPKQDIPLASLMIAPLLGFTSTVIALIRINTHDDTIFSAVKKYNQSPLKEKIAAMFDVINSLKQMSYTLSADALLQAIYDRTDFLNVFSYRYSDGKKKKANLRLMTKYAKSFSQNNFFGGISEFIMYVENIIRIKGDFSSALNNTESDDAVLIKTIHKSKGLEYPFVFLCDIARRYNESDLSEPFVFHSSHGAGVRFQKRADFSEDTDASNPDEWKRYKTFPQFILTQIRKKELRAESLRLLYVALTRAKERLFIAFEKQDIDNSSVIFRDKNGTVPPEIIHNCSDFLSLLSISLSSHPDGFIFRNEKQNHAPNLFITKFFSHEKSLETKEEKAPRHKSSPTVVKQLLETWNQTYPFDDVNNTAKLTVSEIALNSDLARVYSVRNISLNFNNAISETPKLTASEKGTSMHRFLQKCNFNNAEKNLDDEIENLKNVGVMSNLEINGLNRNKLRKFFLSDLYNHVIKPTNPENVHREYKIYAKLCDISLDERLKMEYNISEDSFLQGVTDIVIEKDDGLVLIDYKTNANFFHDNEKKSSQMQFEEHLKALYNLQLKVYAAAVSAIFNKPIKLSCLYSFALDRDVKIELD
jgi:ATP-dependent helicase/nuclease subunit A